MAKEKKSNKGRFGKTKQTAEEKRRAMSHKDQKTQKWKAEKMDEAFRLWEANKDLPPDKQLSMRKIAEIVKIGKTTVIERLSGRRKGHGHITGGARKSRILTKGKQAGHQAGHFNRLTELASGSSSGSSFGTLYR